MVEDGAWIRPACGEAAVRCRSLRTARLVTLRSTTSPPCCIQNNHRFEPRVQLNCFTPLVNYADIAIGVSVDELGRAINAFYRSQQSQDHSQAQELAPLFSEQPPADSIEIDEKLIDKVWDWLITHPDVTVKQLSEDGALVDAAEVQVLREAHANGLDTTATETNEGTDGAVVPSGEPSEVTGAHGRGQHAGERMFTTEDRVWRAIAGHGVDEKKISRLEFQILSIIAAHGPDGVLQPDVTRISGQDKRSVPKRTDSLCTMGYITKEAVLGPGQKTSMLKLKPYATDASLVGPDRARAFHDAEGQGSSRKQLIHYEEWFNEVIRLLRENDNIIAFEDLRKGLGIWRLKWETTALFRCIRRLAAVGCVRRLKARMAEADGQPRKRESNYVRCIQLQRTPTDKDRESFMKADWLGPKRNNRSNYEPTNGLVIMEQEEDAQEFRDEEDSEEDDDDLDLVGHRIPPQWTPDVPYTNLFYNVIESAGVEGISTMDLAARTMGPIWQKPLLDLVGRLTDGWPSSQPANLQHLGLIRDTAAKNRVSYFQFRSQENFAKAVEAGTTAWEAVTNGSTMTGSKSKTKTTPKTTSSAVDEWGFVRISPRSFADKDGIADLAQCRKVPGEEDATSSDFEGAYEKDVGRGGRTSSRGGRLSGSGFNRGRGGRPRKYQQRTENLNPEEYLKRKRKSEGPEQIEYAKRARRTAERLVLAEMKASRKRTAAQAGLDAPQRVEANAQLITVPVSPCISQEAPDGRTAPPLRGPQSPKDSSGASLDPSLITPADESPPKPALDSSTEDSHVPESPVANGHPLQNTKKRTRSSNSQANAEHAMTNLAGQTILPKKRGRPTKAMTEERERLKREAQLTQATAEEHGQQKSLIVKLRPSAAIDSQGFDVLAAAAALSSQPVRKKRKKSKPASDPEDDAAIELPQDRIAELEAEILSMSRPGFYINPPGSRALKAASYVQIGRPRNPMIAVAKSERLKELPWFKQEQRQIRPAPKASIPRTARVGTALGKRNKRVSIADDPHVQDSVTDTASPPTVDRVRTSSATSDMIPEQALDALPSNQDGVSAVESEDGQSGQRSSQRARTSSMRTSTPGPALGVTPVVDASVVKAKPYTKLERDEYIEMHPNAVFRHVGCGRYRLEPPASHSNPLDLREESARTTLYSREERDRYIGANPNSIFHHAGAGRYRLESGDSSRQETGSIQAPLQAEVAQKTRTTIQAEVADQTQSPASNQVLKSTPVRKDVANQARQLYSKAERDSYLEQHPNTVFHHIAYGKYIRVSYAEDGIRYNKEEKDQYLAEHPDAMLLHIGAARYRRAVLSAEMPESTDPQDSSRQDQTDASGHAEPAESASPQSRQKTVVAEQTSQKSSTTFSKEEMSRYKAENPNAVFRHVGRGRYRTDTLPHETPVAREVRHATESAIQTEDSLLAPDFAGDSAGQQREETAHEDDSPETPTEEVDVGADALPGSVPNTELPLVPKKKTTKRAGGFVGHQRSKIILDTVRACGGVFPGNRELYYPFATAWERAQNQTPDRHTVDRLIKSQIDIGKLIRVSFTFNDNYGVPVTKHILVEPGISTTCPAVVETQKKIISHHPSMYVPEQADVSDAYRAKLSGFNNFTSDPRPAIGTKPPQDTVVRHYTRDDFPTDDTVFVRRSTIAIEGGIEARIKHSAELRERSRQANSASYYLDRAQRAAIREPRSHEGFAADTHEPEEIVSEEQAAMQGEFQLPKYQYNPEEAQIDRGPHGRSNLGRRLKTLDVRGTAPGRSLGRLQVMGTKVEAQLGQPQPQQTSLPRVYVSPFAPISDQAPPPTPATTSPASRAAPATPNPADVVIGSASGQISIQHGYYSLLLDQDQVLNTTNWTFSTECTPKLIPFSAPVQTSRPKRQRSRRIVPMSVDEEMLQLQQIEFDNTSDYEDSVAKRQKVHGSQVKTKQRRRRRDPSTGKLMPLPPLPKPIPIREEQLSLAAILTAAAAAESQPDDTQGIGPEDRFYNEIEDVEAFEIRTANAQKFRPGTQDTPQWIHHTFRGKHVRPTDEYENQSEKVATRYAMGSWDKPHTKQGTHSKRGKPPGHAPTAVFPVQKLGQPDQNHGPRGQYGILVATPAAKRPATTPKASKSKVKAHGVVPKSTAKTQVKKRRNTEAAKAFDDVERLVVAVAVVYVLTGGEDLKYKNWGFIAHALHFKYEADFLRHRWITMRPKYGAVADQLLPVFRERFLEAYDNNELPNLDLGKPENIDWVALVDWAQGNLELSGMDGAEVDTIDLPEDRLALKKMFRVQEPAEVLELSREDFWVKWVTMESKDELTHEYLYATALSGSAVPGKIGQDDLLLAKSWIRACCAMGTSAKADHDAHAKLSVLGKDQLLAAYKQMVEDSLIKQEKKGRQMPGRNYDLSDHFLTPFKKPWDEFHLRKVAAAKKGIDQHFEAHGTMAFNYAVSDAEMTTILNLLTCGRIRIVPDLPEVRNDPDAPYPKLSKWGFVADNYKTRQIDDSRFHFDIHFEKTESYIVGVPLKRLPAPKAKPVLNEPGPRLPLWRNIHGNVMTKHWNMILQSILHLLVFRPGMTVEAISKHHRGSLWTWEIELLLEWTEETGVAEKVGYGEVAGYKAAEWWYLAFAEEIAPEEVALGSRQGVGRRLAAR